MTGFQHVREIAIPLADTLRRIVERATPGVHCPECRRDRFWIIPSDSGARRICGLCHEANPPEAVRRNLGAIQTMIDNPGFDAVTIRQGGR